MVTSEQFLPSPAVFLTLCTIVNKMLSSTGRNHSTNQKASKFILPSLCRLIPCFLTKKNIKTATCFLLTCVVARQCLLSDRNCCYLADYLSILANFEIYPYVSFLVENIKIAETLILLFTTPYWAAHTRIGM